MFNSPDFPQPLDEDLFNDWLENGRASRLSYNYLLVIWDERESRYLPVYSTDRDRIRDYQRYPGASSNESLIAAYDLYSESKVG